MVVHGSQNGSEDVPLDASLSSDPDGVIVSYTWTEAGAVVAAAPSPIGPAAISGPFGRQWADGEERLRLGCVPCAQ